MREKFYMKQANSLKNLKNFQCAGKRVFVRVDLNVPLKNGQILSDYRLKAIIQTIDFILKNNGKVILATHLGRPNGFVDKNLSTALLVPWFENRGYQIDFAPDIMKAYEHSKKDFNKILLLENLRFLPEEQDTSKQEAQVLAKNLAQLADIYINDAFAVMHRNDTSITLVPKYFESSQRGIGFLVAQELETLEHLKSTPTQPFILVIGGSKLHDKIGMLENFLQAPEENRIKTIIIGGLLAQAFLRAQGHTMGITPIDDATLQKAHKILKLAQEAQVQISLPTDFYLELTHNYKSRPLTINQIPPNGTIIDIGPTSVQNFSQMLAQAQTIFANGTMGVYENPAYADGTKKILQAIASSPAFSVIGGGDINAAAEMFGITHDIDFCSTGGGATLAYLGAKNPDVALPGLQALIKP